MTVRMSPYFLVCAGEQQSFPQNDETIRVQHQIPANLSAKELGCWHCDGLRLNRGDVKWAGQLHSGLAYVDVDQNAGY